MALKTHSEDVMKVRYNIMKDILHSSLSLLVRAAVSLPGALLCVSLGAHVFDDDLGAVLAVHLTAPVEFTVTAGGHLRAPLLHPQAAVVAQSAAAPSLPLRQAVPPAPLLLLLETLAALGALEPQGNVLLAVVRRVLQVDELRPGDVPERVRDGASVVRAVRRAHALFIHLQFLGPVVFVFEVEPHVPEVGQLRPARFDAAALRHAVASADPLHRGLHCLER